MSEPSPIILERLYEHSERPRQYQFNQAREALQEIILFSLSRAGFFKEIAFGGGTAFRIVYGARRFSEDLDFSTKEQDPSFSFSSFLDRIVAELEDFGLSPRVEDSESRSTIKKARIKEENLLSFLPVKPAFQKGQLIKIKLEVDTRPPGEAKFKQRLLSFPVDHYVLTHDTPTLFSGKLHALLCRKYDKGRDWYDLLRCLSLGKTPNLPYLHAALSQTGPYIDEVPKKLTLGWVSERLAEKVTKLSIEQLSRDTRQFLADEKELELWSKDFFLKKIKKLERLREKSLEFGL